ncbi:hypothetical protein B0H14DRAFT_2596601 [Mycena olivaceomarginata]|nr:hypothetical protein B0H14DRAFT_2596601 [Mycena olivaceomarginata]
MYCDIGQVTEGPALLLRICRAWTKLAIQVPELWSLFILQWHIRGRPTPGPKETRFLISTLQPSPPHYISILLQLVLFFLDHPPLLGPEWGGRFLHRPGQVHNLEVAAESSSRQDSGVPILCSSSYHQVYRTDTGVRPSYAARLLGVT